MPPFLSEKTRGIYLVRSSSLGTLFLPEIEKKNRACSCFFCAYLDSSRQLTRSSESEEVKEHHSDGTSKSTRGTELNENANHGVFGKTDVGC